MKSQVFHNSTAIFPQNQKYLQRTRIFRLMQNALQSPLVVITAGAGFGKTRAVYHFLQQYDAVTGWIQLSERDNLNTRFWENFTHTISLYIKGYADNLAAMGFPETDAQFARFRAMQEDEISLSDRYVFVFDDFHLLHDPSVLRFFGRIINDPTPNFTIILISRAEPAISLSLPMSKGTLSRIDEEDLRFTADETHDFLVLQGLQPSLATLHGIQKDTEGWAFAVGLIALSLKKTPEYQSSLRSAMKLNIFRLIEQEAFAPLSEKLQRFLIRISLLDNLPASLLAELSDDKTILHELSKISSFMRYDAFLDTYRLHHLFLDYLKQKQHLLTDAEKHEAYVNAARWCEANDTGLDAIYYYTKTADYESVIRVMYDFPQQQIPLRSAAFMLDIIEKIPDKILESIAFSYPVHIRMLQSLGRLEEAIGLADRNIARFSLQPPSQFRTRVLTNAYLAFGIGGFLAAPVTHEYNFDQYLKLADEAHAEFPYETPLPKNNQNVGPWISMVGTTRGGAMEEYVTALKRGVPHAASVLCGAMTGMDDLAEGELYYFRGDLKTAERFILRAIHSAGENRQYEIRNRALLRLMCVAMGRGDYLKLCHTLNELESQLEIKQYANRYITYDFVMGWYYAALGKPDRIAEWLKHDFEPNEMAAFMIEFGNIIKARYYYASKDYHALLAFLDRRQKVVTENVLFGRLERKLLEAVSLYHLGQRHTAITALNEAYDLAVSNALIMPFIALGRDMRTLAAAAMKDANCTIPAPWLENIRSKSSGYAKQLSFIISEYNKENALHSNVQLTQREREILTDLYHGLSRSEIAANNGLSINTVKTMLGVVYEKLGATSYSEAIRAAADLRLI